MVDRVLLAKVLEARWNAAHATQVDTPGGSND